MRVTMIDTNLKVCHMYRAMIKGKKKDISILPQPLLHPDITHIFKFECKQVILFL